MEADTPGKGMRGLGVPLWEWGPGGGGGGGGGGWKTMGRSWTVRQEGEDRWTDTEARRWMGTRGRGPQTWDMMGGAVQERKRSGDVEEGGYWHPAWVGAGSRGQVGAPQGSAGILALPRLPLLLPWWSG